MKTITIKFPEELDARLALRAKRLGKSKSELVREAVMQSLEKKGNQEAEEELSAYDVLKDDFGCFNSGVGDLSTNPKHLRGFGK